MSEDLNGIDGKINLRGFFERVLAERDRFDEERDRRMEERWESQTKTASALAERVEASAIALATKVETTAHTLATALGDSQKVSDARISRLENFQSKILGLALGAPFLSAIAVYFITSR